MKDELRYKYKIKRKYFQHSAREVADGAVADEVIRAFADKDGFFIYYSFGSEADTHKLIDRLLCLNKRVFLPRVEGGKIVPVPYSGGELKAGKFGVMEPEGQAVSDVSAIDVCLTPLLAVNARGYRLGYGGGYYDRFFAENPDVLKVGIGYFLQYADDFSEDKWDIPLDLFVCERGIIEFGRRIFH